YDKVASTLTSLQSALDNVNKVASYLGGVENRLSSQEDLLRSQITNYTAAISRIEDADVAQEQMNLIKAQFLQQTSLISLSQANQNPNSFLQLFR
ncbi:flagellin, partial [bacterium]|nr:flagellin [bacterium]